MNKTTIALVFCAFCLVTSCEKDDNEKIVIIRVNHYQEPLDMAEFFYGLAYVVQEDEEIGTDNWNTLGIPISGFDYEMGYVYDIRVKMNTLENTYIDQSNITYTLDKVISKTKVDDDTLFEMVIAIDFRPEYKAYVQQDSTLQYYLFNSDIAINCGDLYNELTSLIENKKGIKAQFKHVDSHTIQLLSIQEYDYLEGGAQ